MKHTKNLIMTLLICCVALISSTALAADSNTNRISVSAGASVEVAPDIAWLSFDAEGTGDSADKAVAQSAAKLDSVKRALLGCNILSDNITTANYYLQPVMNDKNKITGYRAVNSLKIKLTDISKLGTVIDKISGAGVDRINNISFGVSNSDIYRNQLLAQAVVNARQQAEAVATAGGRTLGALISASIYNQGNYERSMSNLMLKADAAGAPAATAIEARSITIKASVETAFALQ